MDNVTQRQNHISGLSEGFTYDALDRLTRQTQRLAFILATLKQNFYSLGNFVFERDVLLVGTIFSTLV